MKHFRPVCSNIDVAPLREQIACAPHLWNVFGYRTTPGMPHLGVSDIWIRYRAYDELTTPGAYKEPHRSVWYPAWNALPALRPIVFDLMRLIEAEQIGGILITRHPPDGSIARHVDEGWHVDFYDKFYLSIDSALGAEFVCDDGVVREALNPSVGEIWHFNNAMPNWHWVENRSNQNRTTLIMCAHLERPYGTSDVAT